MLSGAVVNATAQPPQDPSILLRRRAPAGNVFQVLGPRSSKANDLAPDLTKASSKCKRRPARNHFEPCGDVDAVAKDIVVVNDDVADVDADPKFKPPDLAAFRSAMSS